MLSKEAKYRLHLARISSSFRRSFPASSLIYCVLPTLLPCSFHPPLRCPYQPLMSPANVNSSSSQAYTSWYMSSEACMTSLSFLRAFRNARKPEPPAKVPCTAFRASSSDVIARLSIFLRPVRARCFRLRANLPGSRTLAHTMLWSDKPAVWLSRDNVVNTFSTRGPGIVECTRRASVVDREERVDESNLVVTRKPQKKRGFVTVTHQGVPAICPDYFTILLSYWYTSSSASIY